jgi:hypothetical protein
MKQQGECAFTNACTVPGERIRMQSGQRYCKAHARALSLPSAGGQQTAAEELGGSRSAFVGRRRRGWDTGSSSKRWI